MKDVIDIAKDIKDLTAQKKNPTRKGMIKVIKSVRQHLLLEIEVLDSALLQAKFQSRRSEAPLLASLKMRIQVRLNTDSLSV